MESELADVSSATLAALDAFHANWRTRLTPCMLVCGNASAAEVRSYMCACAHVHVHMYMCMCMLACGNTSEVLALLLNFTT